MCERGNAWITFDPRLQKGKVQRRKLRREEKDGKQLEVRVKGEYIYGVGNDRVKHPTTMPTAQETISKLQQQNKKVPMKAAARARGGSEGT